MSEPTFEQMLRANADLTLRTLHEKLDVDLRYDRASVEWVSGYIERIREGRDPSSLDGLVNNLGAFLGECVIANFGGRWVRDELGIAIYFDDDGRNAVFPLSKVRKQLLNGAPDSILALYDTIPSLVLTPK